MSRTSCSRPRIPRSADEHLHIALRVMLPFKRVHRSTFNCARITTRAIHSTNLHYAIHGVTHSRNDILVPCVCPLRLRLSPVPITAIHLSTFAFASRCEVGLFAHITVVQRAFGFRVMLLLVCFLFASVCRFDGCGVLWGGVGGQRDTCRPIDGTAGLGVSPATPNAIKVFGRQRCAQFCSGRHSTPCRCVCVCSNREGV